MNTRACSPDNILEHGRMGVKPKCKDCYAYLKNAQKLNSFQILKTGMKVQLDNVYKHTLKQWFPPTEPYGKDL